MSSQASAGTQRDTWIRTDVATMYRASEGRRSVGISQRAFHAVRFGPGARAERAISWFDWLLESGDRMGLRVPGELGRPLVVLLSGPPGAGKSQLLQQIAYNRARRWMETQAGLLAKFPRDAWEDGEEGSPRTLMVCTETPAAAVVGNMANMGVRNARHGGHRLFAAGGVGGSAEPLFALVDQEVALEKLSAQNDYRSASVGADEFVRGLQGTWEKMRAHAGGAPSILMIDSLNIFDQARDQAFIVNQLLDAGWYGAGGGSERRSPHVLIVVLDTDPDGGSPGPSAEHLEYLSDVWIRMDLGRFERSDYVGRTLEVIKTRFQARHSGTHMVKIYPGKGVDARECEEIARVVASEAFENSDGNGPKPILPAGGLWIAPSVPDVMSALRREERLVGNGTPAGTQGGRAIEQPVELLQVVSCQYGASSPGDNAGGGTRGSAVDSGDVLRKPAWGVFKARLTKKEDVARASEFAEQRAPLAQGKAVAWPIPWLTYLVRGDMQRRSCAAITGPRSGAKLVIASQFLLDGAMLGEAGLYLSLAERKELVVQRLEDLASHEERYPAEGGDARARRARLVDPITVIHQKAGYVYPEEIVQRVLYWIAVKGIRRAVIAPVDHWETSFPLLANSSMLLATLVELLRAHEIPTMVVAHEDQPGDAEKCGIMALADVIIRFKDMALKVRASELGDLSMWSPEFWEYDVSKGFDIDGFVEGTPFLKPRGIEAVDDPRRPLIAMPFKAIEIVRTAAGLPAAHPAAIIRRLDDGKSMRGGWIDLIPIIPRADE